MYQGTNSNTLAAAIFPNLSLNILHMFRFRILSWSSRQQKLTTPTPSWQQMTFGAENDRLLRCGMPEARPWTNAFHRRLAFPQCEMVFSLHLVGYVKTSIGPWPRRAGWKSTFQNESFLLRKAIRSSRKACFRSPSPGCDGYCARLTHYSGWAFCSGSCSPLSRPPPEPPPTGPQISREALLCLLKNVPIRTGRSVVPARLVGSHDALSPPRGACRPPLPVPATLKAGVQAVPRTASLADTLLLMCTTELTAQKATSTLLNDAKPPWWRPLIFFASFCLSSFTWLRFPSRTVGIQEFTLAISKLSFYFYPIVSGPDILQFLKGKENRDGTWCLGTQELE